MLGIILGAFVLAVGVCADCFAVSICSGVTLRGLSVRKAVAVAFAFAFVQTLFFFLGWSLGELFVGYVEKAAHVIGFLLLAYVGGSMIAGSFKEAEVRSLSGLWNVLIVAVSTSIDALGIGVSLCMDFVPANVIAYDSAAIFLVTFLSVVTGILFGRRLDRRFGSRAELFGGIVLVILGFNILL
ncbi:MAG: manganese efflux pump [Bacteroidales bacterium]|nr:manganese efflux pump [Bacteroidales bacterium]